MSGNFAIKGGGVGRLMANAILNFHFDFPHPSLITNVFKHSYWYKEQKQKPGSLSVVSTTYYMK